MKSFSSLKPIYKILIFVLIGLFLWLVFSLIIQAIQRRPLFSDTFALALPSQTLGDPLPVLPDILPGNLTIPDLPIFNHTYSDNLGNIDPEKFTCNLSLFNDFVGINTLTIELRFPTKFKEGFSGMIIYQCNKIKYT